MFPILFFTIVEVDEIRLWKRALFILSRESGVRGMIHARLTSAIFAGIL